MNGGTLSKSFGDMVTLRLPGLKICKFLLCAITKYTLKIVESQREEYDGSIYPDIHSGGPEMG